MNVLEQAGRGLELLGCARWDREEFERFQGRRLRELVRHACERVPFYRDMFAHHGIAPRHVNGLEDLHRLPVTLRARMQEREPRALTASGLDPSSLVHWRTSGSTGAPFTIRRTWVEDRLLHLLRIGEMRRCGLRWTDLRTSSCLGERPRGHTWNLRDPGFSIFRRAPVNVLAPARAILDRLAELQPDVIVLYAGTLAWICAEATPEDRRRIRPRFVIPTAETLTPHMRSRIRECFGAPVYDFYGAHECNLIASECAETGLYHVEEAGVIVEVLNDGKPCAEGEAGGIHITPLHSFAMPLLRYRLGDVVVRGPARCPCGAPNSTLLRIEGRIVDRFPMPGGGSLHPYHLVLPLTRGCLWVRRYQIVQETISHIRVRVVPAPGRTPDAAERSELLRLLREASGPGIGLTLELTAELPPSASGKFRLYYSKVATA